MELKLINRNAKTINEAYGLTEDEFKELVKESIDILTEKLERFENGEEAEKLEKSEIIAELASTDPVAISTAGTVLQFLEECQLDTVVDIIEMIDMLDTKRQYAYIILLRSYNAYAMAKKIDEIAEKFDEVSDEESFAKMLKHLIEN